MSSCIDKRSLAGVTIIARGASPLKQKLDQALIAHTLLVLQEGIHVLPDFCPPALLDTTHMPPMQLAHVLHQFAKQRAFPIVALAAPHDGVTLRLLACCPAIAAVMGIAPEVAFLTALVRFVATMHADNQYGPVWFEVPPVSIDPQLDLNRLLVALDGAPDLAVVEGRLACSRSSLRRRLDAVATTLGVRATYCNTPLDWQSALITALQLPLWIG